MRKGQRVANMLLACLLCLCLSGTAMATDLNFTVTPLDEMEGPLYFRKTLPGTGLSVYLEIKMRYREIELSPEYKSIVFHTPDMPEALFAYIARYAPEFHDADIGGLSDAELREMMTYLYSDPNEAVYTVEKDFIAGVHVLHVEDTTDADMVHLVTMEGDWLIDLVASAGEEGQSVSAGQLAIQRTLYQAALSSGWMQTVQTLKIPGTEMGIALPEELPLLLYTEEDDLVEGSILYPANHDIQLFNLRAEKKDAYVGKNVMTLETEYIHAILDGLAVSGTALKMCNEAFANGLGAGLMQDDAATHLFIIQDGWMVMLTLLHAIDVDIDEAFAFQQVLLESIAQGGEPPVTIPEALL